jgi:hypothetical protein
LHVSSPPPPPATCLLPVRHDMRGGACEWQRPDGHFNSLAERGKATIEERAPAAAKKTKSEAPLGSGEAFTREIWRSLSQELDSLISTPAGQAQQSQASVPPAAAVKPAISPVKPASPQRTAPVAADAGAGGSASLARGSGTEASVDSALSGLDLAAEEIDLLRQEIDLDHARGPAAVEKAPPPSPASVATAERAAPVSPATKPESPAAEPPKPAAASKPLKASKPVKGGQAGAGGTARVAGAEESLGQIEALSDALAARERDLAVAMQARGAAENKAQELREQLAEAEAQYALAGKEMQGELEASRAMRAELAEDLLRKESEATRRVKPDPGDQTEHTRVLCAALLAAEKERDTALAALANLTIPAAAKPSEGSGDAVARENKRLQGQLDYAIRLNRELDTERERLQSATEQAKSRAHKLAKELEAAQETAQTLREREENARAREEEARVQLDEAATRLAEAEDKEKAALSECEAAVARAAEAARTLDSRVAAARAEANAEAQRRTREAEEASRALAGAAERKCAAAQREAKEAMARSEGLAKQLERAMAAAEEARAAAAEESKRQLALERRRGEDAIQHTRKEAADAQVAAQTEREALLKQLEETQSGGTTDWRLQLARRAAEEMDQIIQQLAGTLTVRCKEAAAKAAEMASAEEGRVKALKGARREMGEAESVLARATELLGAARDLQAQVQRTLPDAEARRKALRGTLAAAAEAGASAAAAAREAREARETYEAVEAQKRRAADEARTRLEAAEAYARERAEAAVAAERDRCRGEELAMAARRDALQAAAETQARALAAETEARVSWLEVKILGRQRVAELGGMRCELAREMDARSEAEAKHKAARQHQNQVARDGGMAAMKKSHKALQRKRSQVEADLTKIQARNANARNAAASSVTRAEAELKRLEGELESVQGQLEEGLERLENEQLAQQKALKQEDARLGTLSEALAEAKAHWTELVDKLTSVEDRAKRGLIARETVVKIALEGREKAEAAQAALAQAQADFDAQQERVKSTRASTESLAEAAAEARQKLERKAAEVKAPVEAARKALAEAQEQLRVKDAEAVEDERGVRETLAQVEKQLERATAATAAAEDVEAVARAAEDDAREARASEARLEANFAQLSREGRAAAGRARELRVALRRATAQRQGFDCKVRQLQEQEAEAHHAVAAARGSAAQQQEMAAKAAQQQHATLAEALEEAVSESQRWARTFTERQEECARCVEQGQSRARAASVAAEQLARNLISGAEGSAAGLRLIAASLGERIWQVGSKVGDLSFRRGVSLAREAAALEHDVQHRKVSDPCGHVATRAWPSSVMRVLLHDV